MAKPKPVGSILETTLKGLELDFQLKAYSIWGAWTEIVGRTVADQAQPRSIRNRILFIDVSHSTWLHQLQFIKPKILEKLNAYIGEPLLQDIRFRLGTITPPPSRPAIEDRLRGEEQLDERTTERIDALVQGVKDDEVRRSLRDFLIKGAKSSRDRGK